MDHFIEKIWVFLWSFSAIFNMKNAPDIGSLLFKVQRIVCWSLTEDKLCPSKKWHIHLNPKSTQDSVTATWYQDWSEQINSKLSSWNIEPPSSDEIRKQHNVSTEVWLQVVGSRYGPVLLGQTFNYFFNIQFSSCLALRFKMALFVFAVQKIPAVGLCACHQMPKRGTMPATKEGRKSQITMPGSHWNGLFPTSMFEKNGVLSSQKMELWITCICFVKSMYYFHVGMRWSWITSATDHGHHQKPYFDHLVITLFWETAEEYSKTWR